MFNRNKLIVFSALTGLIGCAAVQNASGFALLGNFAPFQTPALGYNQVGNYGADVGGPMALGDEYRWNIPVIVYGFDGTFVDYFGSKGVLEVGKAFTILNNLPAASKMSAALTEFPLDTLRENYRAANANLTDIKSFSLGYMVEGLGLANPERYTWTMYARTLTGTAPNTNYFVISRNYDPVTLLQTNAVNGSHYGYEVHEYVNPNFTEADEYQKVDPAHPGFRSVAGYRDYQAGAGTFLTGLTRDDAGGLRYIYNPKNFNNEGIVQNVTLPPGGAASVGAVRLPGGTSPYSSPFGINTISTAPANAFDSAFGSTLTNVITATNVVTTNALLVNLSLRGGVDKLTFIQGKFDSLLGFTFKNITNNFSDRYVTNGAFSVQVVQRVITTPDVIFAAGDLGLGAGNLAPFRSTRSLVLTSFGANNTIVGTRPGPGVISGRYTITLNNVVPIEFNQVGRGVDDTSATRFLRWGSFDGSDAEPTVYPQGSSILDVENEILTP